MKWHDQVTGAILFVLSVYYVFEALKMPLMAGKAPGAGWLPAILGVLMALLSALLFLSATRRPDSTDRPVTWPSGRGLANNVAILSGLVICVLVLEVAGYVASTFIFLFGLLLFLGRYSLKFSTAVALASTAVLYWVFKIWLEIPLPSGFIKIL